MPWKKAGPGRPRVDPDIRFWSKVNKTPSCWTWTAQINADGYGRFNDGTRKVLAHRYAWEGANGPIPDGMQVDHKCLNRSCVNPSHLRIATQFENMQNLAGAQKRNPTGARGVTRTRAGNYRVMVVHRGECHYGGRFPTIEEAEKKAIEMRLALFTHNEIDKAVSA